MKQELLNILYDKMKAILDEDHEPLVYGHEDAVKLIMQAFRNEIVSALNRHSISAHLIDKYLLKEGFISSLDTVTINSCTFCGNRHIEWITKYEDPENGDHCECLTCGHTFDEPKKED